MRRRFKELLAFPLILIVYLILTVVERFLEGDHYSETIQ